MENFNTIEQQKFDRATRRVKSIAGFYRHFMIYLLVNLLMLAVKYIQLDANEEFFTFSNFSTAFFWGIGVVFHALGVFSNNVFFGKNWEERKIRELMEKEKKQKWE
ncbi:MAG TPA: 2TM domain-containing protein [Flavobacterium sp.]|jgi:hypothetical protein